MRRILCVAEKNDVAKGVAAILSKGQMVRREGRSVYNKIYNLNAEILGQYAELSMTSVSGHLMEHCFGSDMKNWNTVPVRTLFDAPVYRVVPEGMKNIARTLEEESAKCGILVIWTDCDREGESIGAEIAEVCSKSNPQIDIYRARFSEITRRAILQASRNLTRLDQKVVDAVECRSELDLRIGAAFTRLQTLHLQQRFGQLLSIDGKQVVSYGSCQFPTLGFVVERYKAIESFISETFWKLVVDHRRGDAKVEFTWDRVRLFDQDVVQILYDDCLEAGHAKIEAVSSKPKSKFRPQGLDTVELEKLAVRKLKMSAKRAMDVAEKLYNKGYISYPRTETNKFPPDINLESLVNKLITSSQWGDFANEVLQHGPNPRNGNKSDEAHPPIHPLKLVTDGSLQGEEWRVYELVVRHFLACVSWDAKGLETRVEMRIGGETFHATGLCIQDLGFSDIMRDRPAINVENYTIYCGDADENKDAAKETIPVQMPRKNFAFAFAEIRSTYNSVYVVRSAGDFNQEKRLRRKSRRQLQQDHDNGWTSDAVEFEKALKDKSPRKIYAELLLAC
ncbi:hypothetical protein RB195_009979 [Necator americanus]|uniref:DNA topoisomerase n=1 Tax=Necator americanus TaxID=51031 RepID=A0ABR1CXN5_NECAM